MTLGLEWEETGHRKWRLHAPIANRFGLLQDRTYAFVHEYRRHYKRRARAVVYPLGMYNATLVESKQFKTVAEAKGWAVAVVQLGGAA